MSRIVPDLVIAGGGRITTGGAKLFNLYRPPVIGPVEGDVKLYADHWKRLYPGECEEMLDWLSFKVQHPEIKINHAIGMGGAEGIGKDTLLAPIREAVGPWNFAEVSPGRVLKGDFNEYMQSVILRVNEAHDVGDFNRFDFHERTKTMIAAPPEGSRDQRQVPATVLHTDLTGVIILTNHKTLGLYLPRTDRRHLIGWSERLKSEMAEYCAGLWNWYEKENGFAKVAHFLRSRDLSKFNPKAEPRKTAAWHLIVDAGMSRETSELGELLDLLDRPKAVTLSMVAIKANEYRQRAEFGKSSSCCLSARASWRRNSRTMATVTFGIVARRMAGGRSGAGCARSTCCVTCPSARRMTRSSFFRLGKWESPDG